jgi:hypothetical protein
MKRIQIFIPVGALALALVLAFAMQDVIRETVIIPLTYLMWVLGYTTEPSRKSSCGCAWL